MKCWSQRGRKLALVAAMLLACGACQMRGKPAPGPEVPRPDSILDPVTLYAANCAGCHGADGQHGAAPPIGDPVYLAIATDADMQTAVVKGRAGTAMSAFAQKEGGMLTNEQIKAIIRGIRERWSKPGVLDGVTHPPYTSDTVGDAHGGEAAYTTFCSSCHGSGAQGGPKAGSVMVPAYLNLVSDQGLRTIVITGRPDFNAPDWRNNVPGRPMSDKEISDTVAYLASLRPAPARQPSMATTAGGAH